ncbi:MAG: cation:proton antiporter [Proteobacteria bacterium]|nr:cation:proton antiporter [Pseudomonadota bacterium]
MHTQTPLISTIVIALVLAFAFGALVHRARISPLVGYLLAGIFIGQFAPGFAADPGLAKELAEIGVILLMFGVGLHFSRRDLFSVRAIAIPGAFVQIAVVTLLGMGLGRLLGWTPAGGFVFGLALSVASTVVVLRVLQERRLVETERGRIAIGWLIVEDIIMVFTLVLLPPLTGILNGDAPWNMSALAEPLATTFIKIAGFIIAMFIVGIRVIPWLLHYVAHTGSRELFRLAVLAISQLGLRAASASLPLRDAFAVLFFVSVGMLFDPGIVLKAPFSLIAVIIIIVACKAGIGFAIMRVFRYPQSTSLMVAASRAQIGEFSFILAALGVSLGILPQMGRDLILAGAIFSILLNPLLYAAIDQFSDQYEPQQPVRNSSAQVAEPPSRHPIETTTLRDHVVLVGHGRVGRTISKALSANGIPFLVIEDDVDIAEALRARGVQTINGNGADPEVMNAANFAAARCLLVAIPDGFEGGQVVAQARALNAALPIIARAHSDEEVAHLQLHGATMVVMGEEEIAKSMLADIGARFSDLAHASSEAPREAPAA